MTIDKMVDAYLEAGLWSTSIFGGENDMQVMDEFYDLDDCANRDDVEAEVTEFFLGNLEDIMTIVREHGATPEQVGHDFLLTRDRHGAGFWDRGYGLAGDRLTKAAHVYGESGFTPVYDDDEQQTDKFICEGSTR